MSLVSFCILIGAIAFALGFLLLLAPDSVRKLNELSAKMIAKIDTLTFSYRVGVGVSLIIAALFMFFMAYYFTKRH
ncbi:MAG: hypothetical protein Q8M71_12700 [Thermodesulfovibrionales bacterium]|nr:hypothetical protein [Thermodesulfovibrionales bacterium]